jgi:parallel beta-helix repeat protein
MWNTSAICWCVFILSFRFSFKNESRKWEVSILFKKNNSSTNSGISGLSDIDFSVPPTNNDTLSYDSTTLKWLPKALTTVGEATGVSTYTIELSRWGITQGIPSKPYSIANYTTADANIQGINNALQYAYTKGYTEVVFPRGQYAICYPKEITMISNLMLNLNGSTLKVIYDSDNKSPFDTRTTTDYYKFIGNSIVFNNVENSHLVGGTIIGCRDDRSFSNSAEIADWGTYGVVFKRGASYCTVRNCTTRDYMGDNITVSSDSVRSIVEFSQGLTLNGLDYTTGHPTVSSNNLITKYLTLPTDAVYSSMAVTGTGSSRQTNLTTKEFDLFFYGANNAFIGVAKVRKIYTAISIPVNAVSYRIMFYNETDISKYMQITVNYGSLPHHNVIEYNTVYNGFRGGISLGGSYNIIQHNVIRDNGKNSNTWLDGKPSYSDPTKYGINQEDSYGDNCVIRNNLIYGSSLGILVGCYSTLIEGNHLYNIDANAINLYALSHATVRNNYIYNCGGSIGTMTAILENASINITGNRIFGGVTILNGTGYQVSITDNTFVDQLTLQVPDDLTMFKNNYVKYTTSTGTNPTVLINKLDGCIFEGKTARLVDLKAYEYRGCIFKNLSLNIKTRNELTLSENVTMDECRFISSTISNAVFNTKAKEIKIRRSKFEDSIVSIGNTNTDNEYPSIILEDCSIKATSINSILKAGNNRAYGAIKLDKCFIEIANANFSYLLDSVVYASSVIASVKNSEIRYTGFTSAVPTLNLKYYSNSGFMRSFITANNTFKNILLPTQDVGIYVGYDPDKYSSSSPVSGYYNQGQISYNSSPSAGGYLGWICITGGYTENTSWAAATFYPAFTRVLYNGNIYEAQNQGKTAKTQPTFPTSGAVNDTSGVVTRQNSHVYSVGDLVLPTTANGCYYECVTAGTSSTTEPIWLTNVNFNMSSSADNGVVWIPRKIITWLLVGTPAVFKQFGTIQA